ncbi:MAG: efflux RND transporter permease subunit, partial [Anaerovoracaceae bacterium]
MKLIDTSVKRPIGVIMIVIAVVLIGAIALGNLSIDLYPELEVPFTIVVTEYNDAGPEEVENLVTRMIEMTLSGIEGIKTLQSVSATGQSLVVLEFDWGTSLDTKVSDIRSKLDR